ncbi:hypothetical protein JHD50_05130 [Sulfurimonas sp. MAG313]|nr:hypothetical protein [Sulfurimonas sp. MAG313]MDF1880691.1 hypothetical protein [Sulfurimonas sp. MAG313]
MKNSNQLVSHLRSQSAFSPLNNQACIESVKELLPPRLHRFILFGYIRHNIVFFALNHPGAKQEFDNIINSIKTPLKQIPPLSCKNYEIYDVRAFVSHKKHMTFTAVKPTYEEFEERAEAEFENIIENKKLFQVFEEIRDIIKNK